MSFSANNFSQKREKGCLHDLSAQKKQAFTAAKRIASECARFLILNKEMPRKVIVEIRKIIDSNDSEAMDTLTSRKEGMALAGNKDKGHGKRVSKKLGLAFRQLPTTRSEVQRKRSRIKI